MAVNVDAVYQKVLALANKEQRGYITPLEFNLMANQAQLDIFEQYFYDLDQTKRVPAESIMTSTVNPKSSISTIPEHIRYKLLDHITHVPLTNGTNLPPEVFAIGRIYLHGRVNFRAREVRKIDENELRNILESEFHRKGLAKHPVYINYPWFKNKIVVYGENEAGEITNITAGGVPWGVSAEIVNKPEKVEWGYDVIQEKALYNAGRSTDFQLHQSEEGPLVIKILQLAGITLNKIGLAQTAIELEQAKIQQQKM